MQVDVASGDGGDRIQLASWLGASSEDEVLKAVPILNPAQSSSSDTEARKPDISSKQ